MVEQHNSDGALFPFELLQQQFEVLVNTADLSLQFKMRLYRFDY